MFATFRAFILRRLGGLSAAAAPTAPEQPSFENPADAVDLVADQDDGSTATYAVPYDEHLFERARMQWQFGDWQSLAALDRDSVQSHPERAKLALLAAAGQSQLGSHENARTLVRLALGWGCSKRLVAQVLAAGVHNSLGRAAAAAGMQARALEHMKNAVAIGTPGSDIRLTTNARVQEQFAQIGLSPPQPLPNERGGLVSEPVAAGLASGVR